MLKMVVIQGAGSRQVYCLKDGNITNGWFSLAMKT